MYKSNINSGRRPFKHRFLAPLKPKLEKKILTAPMPSPLPKFSKFSQRKISAPGKSKAFPIRQKNIIPIPPSGDNIRIIPLGGVEEIGKNMTVVEYKGDNSRCDYYSRPPGSHWRHSFSDKPARQSADLVSRIRRAPDSKTPVGASPFTGA